VIVDPEREVTKEIFEAGINCHFPRKVVYENIKFDLQLPEKVQLNTLRQELGRYCSIEDAKECWIVYHKAEN
jgi:hypothetical protein